MDLIQYTAVQHAGVVDHGLFLNMVDVVIIAAKDGVQVKDKAMASATQELTTTSA